MTTSVTQYEALKIAAEEFIRKVDNGEAKNVRSYNAFKLALALPETNSLTLDDLTEIVSMMSDTTKKQAISDFENARSMATAELAEQDLSEGAKNLLQRHKSLASIMLSTFTIEQFEVNSLNKKV